MEDERSETEGLHRRLLQQVGELETLIFHQRRSEAAYP